MTEGIRDVFKGADVLLTGGTGFMGKVLIEKLLRCTDVNRIYVVVRPKRGLGPQTRIREMFKLPLFDLIRKESQDKWKKVIALEGDLTKENFALPNVLIKELSENVSFVFNFAASLKLEDPLKALIAHNTVSALRLLNLALNFKKLKAFVHLSTAFCHCEIDVLEQKMYDCSLNPYNIMDTLEWMDDKLAETITPKLLGLHPNCYTFTKRLAECLMKDFSGKLPITVVRPSIVTPALHEPLPGWVDNLNGPMGVLVAGAKGVLRSMLCTPDNNAEVIPVDIAINGVLIAAWNRARTPLSVGGDDVLVYNVSIGDIEPVTWGEVLEVGRSKLREYPLDCGLWYPGGTIRTNPFTHALIVFFAQTIPAYFIDFIFLLLRQKRFMVRVQNRIKLGMNLLQYFTMRAWKFETSALTALNQELPPPEQKVFFLGNTEYNIQDYMKYAILGARVYCMKEPLENLPRARRQLKMMYCIEKIAQIGSVVFLSWLIYNCILLFGTFVGEYDRTQQKFQRPISA